MQPYYFIKVVQQFFLSLFSDMKLVSLIKHALNFWFDTNQKLIMEEKNNRAQLTMY